MATLNRRRAAAVAAASVNARAALRAALEAPNYTGGPPLVAIPAPQLLTLLRAATGCQSDAPSRRIHAALFRGFTDAAEHLTLHQHRGRAPAESVAAVRLAARLAARWLAHQTRLQELEEARRLRLRAQIARRRLTAHEKMGSQPVLTVVSAPNPLKSAARKHWRHRSRAEQAAIDLERAAWDARHPPSTPETQHAAALRSARLASYTAEELAQAAELRAGVHQQPQEPTMAKKATTSSTAAAPASPATPRPTIPKPGQPGRDHHGDAHTPDTHGSAAATAAEAGMKGGSTGKTIQPTATAPKQRRKTA